MIIVSLLEQMDQFKNLMAFYNYIKKQKKKRMMMKKKKIMKMMKIFYPMLKMEMS